MTNRTPPKAPPFCPNPECPYHKGDKRLWRYVRHGTFTSGRGRRVHNRYKCLRCGRSFSDRTFRASYWLKRADLLIPTARRLVACAGYRQIAREFEVSPQTVARHAARLGQHALLFHETLRRRHPVNEPLALDSFVSFAYSQYFPTHYHVVAGRQSHYFYGFMESERRRGGTMTTTQKRRREELEHKLGRPDPRANEKAVTALLRLLLDDAQSIDLASDQDHDYSRAIRHLGVRVRHHTVSSRAARTARNPLFSINLLDLLIRHSSANHKRETIAFSKSRAGAIHRLWLFLAWRNYVKVFSEKSGGLTPAQRVGITSRRWKLRALFGRRKFATRASIPAPWLVHWGSRTPTRAIGARKKIPLRFAS